ncbi:Uncharacterised protein [[Eubacterium] contortum]|uniref:HTH cro/C1-type domain-containing protein n=1 Tax=Faecalicatena contorta TaxID=39482 RepID=A0A174II82_9FIRM|nr:hypothetical protein [Faecalicatena contorta]CUO85866.1 Uncharacterised protein [[Eubacterium] contortum] [Faecalicatena contorta]
MFEVDVEAMKNYLDEVGLKQKPIAIKSGLDECKFSLALQGKRKLEAGEYASVCKSIGVPMRKFLKPRMPDEKDV